LVMALTICCENRRLKLPHSHIGPVLNFGTIHFGLAANYNPARKARYFEG